jgi:hypothetical protein
MNIDRFWLLPELLFETFRYLGCSDLRALCLVSHGINPCAAEILYEDIRMKLQPTKLIDPTSNPLRQLFQTLETRPDLIKPVKRIQVIFAVENHDLLADDGDAHALFSYLVKVIKSCHQLKSLSILDPGCWFQPSPSRDLRMNPRQMPPLSGSQPLLEIERCFDHLLQLRKFEFVSWTDYWPCPMSFERNELDFGISIMNRALQLPRMETIALTLLDSSVDISKLSFPVSQTLTSLSLMFSSIEPDGLRNVLFSAPHLKHLSLDIVMHVWCQMAINTQIAEPWARLDSQELGNILSFLYMTLETLKVKIRFKDYFHTINTANDSAGGNAGLWGPFGSIGSFKTCSNLRSLEIAPELLLGWEDKGQGSGIPLAELLPDSLQALRLRTDFMNWYGSPWHGSRSLLADELATSLPHLNLHKFRTLALLSHAEDKHEDVSPSTELESYFQSVITEARKFGVQFEMTKTDYPFDEIML